MSYILFVVQEANFCPRVFLAPHDPFVKVREDEYLTLKKYSKKVILEGKEVNLIINDIIRKNNLGIFDDSTPFWTASSVIMRYGDYLRDGEDILVDIKDSIWTKDSIFVHNSSHFDPIDICRYIISKNEYSISDCFVLLESHNGVLKRPAFKTVNEMFEEMYMDK